MKIEDNEYIRTKNGLIFKATEYWLNELTEKIKENIKTHSKNIIDLIQCGDYVNGYEVISVDYKEDENHNYFDILGVYCIEDDYAYTIELNRIHIKSILTKEQYEQNSYKL